MLCSFFHRLHASSHCAVCLFIIHSCSLSFIVEYEWMAADQINTVRYAEVTEHIMFSFIFIHSLILQWNIHCLSASFYLTWLYHSLSHPMSCMILTIPHVLLVAHLHIKHFPARIELTATLIFNMLLWMATGKQALSHPATSYHYCSITDYDGSTRQSCIFSPAVLPLPKDLVWLPKHSVKPLQHHCSTCFHQPCLLVSPCKSWGGP